MQLHLSSQLTQVVYDQVLNAAYNTPFSRFKAKFFTRLFNLIKETHDPLVKHNINGVTLLIPFSHKLPFILKDFPQYSSNLARLAKYAKHKYDDLHFIDVGANVGDTVAVLREESFFPILCIEGDQQFFTVLKTNIALFSKAYVSQTYLGELDKEINAFVNKNAGTAHLSSNHTSIEVISVKKLTNVLQEHPQFLGAKMLKIDTDGFDCKIIRGAIEYIHQAKPVVFFEYDPFFLAQQGDDGLSVFKLFVEAGYQKLIIYDNFGDLLLTCNVNDFDLLHHIYLFFSGRLGRYYCDICAFHAEDYDLFQQAKFLETQFLEETRGITNAYPL